MIRPTHPQETGHLMAIARGTGVFKPIEIEALEEVLDDYHDGNLHQGHQAVTFEQDGRAIGFAYYAPTPMTDRTWHLYWIFVEQQIQAKGIGAKLLKHAEEEIRRLSGRMLIIETSALPIYDLTRKFYVKHGYEITGVIRDFYADGDDMVVFRKLL
jgi:GNAT superfamily N-acetyltransferase